MTKIRLFAFLGVVGNAVCAYQFYGVTNWVMGPAIFGAIFTWPLLLGVMVNFGSEEDNRNAFDMNKE